MNKHANGGSMKHTPGKLTVHGLALATTDKLPAQLMNKDPRQLTIAHAAFDSEETDLEKPWDYDTAAANAERLAHAWNCHDELVEALSACESLLDGQISDVLTGDQCDELGVYAALESARAALAKAKGEA